MLMCRSGREPKYIIIGIFRSLISCCKWQSKWIVNTKYFLWRTFACVWVRLGEIGFNWVIECNWLSYWIIINDRSIDRSVGRSVDWLIDSKCVGIFWGVGLTFNCVFLNIHTSILKYVVFQQVKTLFRSSVDDSVDIWVHLFNTLTRLNGTR